MNTQESNSTLLASLKNLMEQGMGIEPIFGSMERCRSNNELIPQHMSVMCMHMQPRSRKNFTTAVLIFEPKKRYALTSQRVKFVLRRQAALLRTMTVTHMNVDTTLREAIRRTGDDDVDPLGNIRPWLLRITDGTGVLDLKFLSPEWYAGLDEAALAAGREYLQRDVIDFLSAEAQAIFQNHHGKKSVALPSTQRSRVAFQQASKMVDPARGFIRPTRVNPFNQLEPRAWRSIVESGGIEIYASAHQGAGVRVRIMDVGERPGVNHRTRQKTLEAVGVALSLLVLAAEFRINPVAEMEAGRLRAQDAPQDNAQSDAAGDSEVSPRPGV